MWTREHLWKVMPTRAKRSFSLVCFVVISVLFALALNIIWFGVVVAFIEKLPLYFYRNPFLTCFRAGKAKAGPGLCDRGS